MALKFIKNAILLIHNVLFLPKPEELAADIILILMIMKIKNVNSIPFLNQNFLKKLKMNMNIIVMVYIKESVVQKELKMQNTLNGIIFIMMLKHMEKMNVI